MCVSFSNKILGQTVVCYYYIQRYTRYVIVEHLQSEWDRKVLI